MKLRTTFDKYNLIIIIISTYIICNKHLDNTCPNTRGSRTVLESCRKIDENGTVVCAPIITSRRIGVTMIPYGKEKLMLSSGDYVPELGSY